MDRHSKGMSGLEKSREQRRQSSNKRERQRVKNLNMAFDTLNSVLEPYYNGRPKVSQLSQLVK